MARSSGGDAWLHAVGRGNAAPAPLESAGFVSRAREQLDRCLHLVFLGERGRDGVALGKLRGKPQHLVPCARAALGAQQKPRGGDVLGTRAVKVAQRLARGVEVAILERELCAAYEAR